MSPAGIFIVAVDVATSFNNSVLLDVQFFQLVLYPSTLFNVAPIVTSSSYLYVFSNASSDIVPPFTTPDIFSVGVNFNLYVFLE